MMKKSGIVESTARTGKAIKIGGEWYSAFTAASLNGAKNGDNVEFSYTTSEKDGVTYRNIKGAVKIVAPSGGVAITPISGGSGPAPAAAGGHSRAGRSFPVGPLDPERSIIRQNALTQANKACETWFDNHSVGDSFADLGQFCDAIINMAQKFEAYAAGDLDAAIAAEAVEKMRMDMSA